MTEVATKSSRTFLLRSSSIRLCVHSASLQTRVHEPPLCARMWEHIRPQLFGLLTAQLCSYLFSCPFQQYLSCSEKLYQSRLQAVDFQKSTEETRQAINAWVARKTNGKSHMCLQTRSVLS